jgi:MinD superfamily P-loop ATPase
MKELVVISGKGGTGKTSITASFAVLESDKIMVDCDVDASDLYLILKPKIIKKEKFICGKTAKIVSDKCIMCGQCMDVCRFEAIKNYIVDPIACEGCGFCYNICPVDAVVMEDNLSGHWFSSDTKYGKMIHAALGAGEENSGRLVSLVRKEAKEIAEKEKKELIIIDGPPGTGCPVLSSITGTDLVLIVTEPTCSGLHDLERILEVVSYFKLPALVCINKWDINKDVSEDIERYCFGKGVNVVGKVSFHKSVVQALVKGKSVIEEYDNEVTEEIKKMWDEIKKYLKE